jgi:hypothetical protein
MRCGAGESFFGGGLPIRIGGGGKISKGRGGERKELDLLFFFGVFWISRVFYFSPADALATSVSAGIGGRHSGGGGEGGGGCRSVAIGRERRVW